MLEENAAALSSGAPDWDLVTYVTARSARVKALVVSSDGSDDGRIERFLDAVWTKAQPSNTEVHCLMNLAMAATYDPDPEHPETEPQLLAKLLRLQQESA